MSMSTNCRTRNALAAAMRSSFFARRGTITCTYYHFEEQSPPDRHVHHGDGFLYAMPGTGTTTNLSRHRVYAKPGYRSRRLQVSVVPKCRVPKCAPDLFR